MLVTSTFSFSHNVFKRLLSEDREYPGLFGKGLSRLNARFKWCFTPLSTLFQSYHGVSSQYSRLSWVSQVQGWGSEMSCPRKSHEKTGSKAGPVDYESNSVPLSHGGPRKG